MEGLKYKVLSTTSNSFASPFGNNRPWLNPRFLKGPLFKNSYKKVDRSIFLGGCNYYFRQPDAAMGYSSYQLR